MKGDEWIEPPFVYSGKYDGRPPGCITMIVITVLLLAAAIVGGLALR